MIYFTTIPYVDSFLSYVCGPNRVIMKVPVLRCTTHQMGVVKDYIYISCVQGPFATKSQYMKPVGKANMIM